jgi:hypothetical protein
MTYQRHLRRKNQRTKGPKDQRTKRPKNQRTKEPKNQRTKEPKNQRTKEIQKMTVGLFKGVVGQESMPRVIESPPVRALAGSCLWRYNRNRKGSPNAQGQGRVRMKHSMPTATWRPTLLSPQLPLDLGSQRWVNHGETAISKATAHR